MARRRTGLYPPQTLTSDTTILKHHVNKYGEWVITSSGVRVTLCVPRKSHTHSEFTIVNATSGYSVVDTTSGYMLDGGDSIIIGPYDSVLIKAVKTASATYRWSAVGTYERGV